MTEAIAFADLISHGDRVAWPAGPMEPATLLRALDAQLDRIPRASPLLNLSLEHSIDAARLGSRMHVIALGGAVTNRRFQDIGALDVLPVNYSALPELVATRRLGINVVLLQLAADGDAFNLSLRCHHFADAIPRA